jgi:hypothetical protein
MGGDKFFSRAPFTLVEAEGAKLIPAPHRGRTVAVMQNHVLKRHKSTPTIAWPVSARNSESSYRPAPESILPVWPKDLSDRTRTGREKLIAIIERELRKERRRGIAGERAYDLARHAHLARLLREERDALAKLAPR